MWCSSSCPAPAADDTTRPGLTKALLWEDKSEGEKNKPCRRRGSQRRKEMDDSFKVKPRRAMSSVGSAVRRRPGKQRRAVVLVLLGGGDQARHEPQSTLPVYTL